MIPIIGTHLQGRITTTYARLVEVFGEPNAEHDDYESHAEWAMRTSAGDVVTIYDYKQGRVPVEDITSWHIGGHTSAVTGWVKRQLSAAK